MLLSSGDHQRVLVIYDNEVAYSGSLSGSQEALSYILSRLSDENQPMRFTGIQTLESSPNLHQNTQLRCSREKVLIYCYGLALGMMRAGFDEIKALIEWITTNESLIDDGQTISGCMRELFRRFILTLFDDSTAESNSCNRPKFKNNHRFSGSSCLDYLPNDHDLSSLSYKPFSHKHSPRKQDHCSICFSSKSESNKLKLSGVTRAQSSIIESSQKVFETGKITSSSSCFCPDNCSIIGLEVAKQIVSDMEYPLQTTPPVEVGTQTNRLVAKVTPRSRNSTCDIAVQDENYIVEDEHEPVYPLPKSGAQRTYDADENVVSSTTGFYDTTGVLWKDEMDAFEFDDDEHLFTDNHTDLQYQRNENLDIAYDQSEIHNEGLLHWNSEILPAIPFNTSLCELSAIPCSEPNVGARICGSQSPLFPHEQKFNKLTKLKKGLADDFDDFSDRLESLKYKLEANHIELNQAETHLEHAWDVCDDIYDATDGALQGNPMEPDEDFERLFDTENRIELRLPNLSNTHDCNCKCHMHPNPNNLLRSSMTNQSICGMNQQNKSTLNAHYKMSMSFDVQYENKVQMWNVSSLESQKNDVSDKQIVQLSEDQVLSKDGFIFPDYTFDNDGELEWSNNKCANQYYAG